MKKWKKLKISDIGEVVGGSTPPTANSEYYGGDIPWLTPKDLSDYKFRLISHGERNITNLGLKNCSTRLLPKHTILFSSRAPIGYVAIAGNEICTNQGFKSIIPSDDIDYMFLYYLLKYNKNDLESLGTGTTFKEISGTVMKNFEVCIPELDTQKRIADILSSLDNKIELNNRINKVLEEIAQTLFKHWFVDFEFPNEEGKPYKSSGGKMVQSYYDEVPVIGKIVSYGDFLTPRNEKSSDNKIPEYSVTNTGIHPREKTFNKKLSSAGSKNKIIHKYDLVFGMSREILNWGLMKDEIGGVSSAYNVFIVDSAVNPIYLESYMKCRQSYFDDVIRPATREGQGIDKDVLMGKLIYLPPYTLIDKYNSVINKIQKIIEKYNIENINLIDIRYTLMSKLMSGEIEL